MVTPRGSQIKNKELNTITSSHQLLQSWGDPTVSLATTKQTKSKTPQLAAGGTGIQLLQSIIFKMSTFAQKKFEMCKEREKK